MGPLGEEDSVAVQVLPSTLAFMKGKLEESVARVPTAHNRLRNAQTGGSVADVQFFRHGHEIPQVPQFHTARVYNLYASALKEQSISGPASAGRV